MSDTFTLAVAIGTVVFVVAVAGIVWFFESRERKRKYPNGVPRYGTFTFKADGYWETRDDGSRVLRLTDGNTIVYSNGKGL